MQAEHVLKAIQLSKFLIVFIKLDKFIKILIK